MLYGTSQGVLTACVPEVVDARASVAKQLLAWVLAKEHARLKSGVVRVVRSVVLRFSRNISGARNRPRVIPSRCNNTRFLELGEAWLPASHRAAGIAVRTQGKSSINTHLRFNRNRPASLACALRLKFRSP